MGFFGYFVVFLACVFGCHGDGIHHNLPPGVELVDPKSLGFESQLDLDKLLGNVKLLPINSQTDPKTGTKTQVLTVGFDNDENINLDDFELPQSPNSNNTDLVNSAFNSFKQYFNKNKNVSTATTTEKPRGSVVMRRRKVVKATTTTTPSPPGQPPKVIELDSSQIEKLLATGKLTSKKVGDSQVIEITQEQLNQLYSMENGGEFRELLDTTSAAEVTSTTTAKPQVSDVPLRVSDVTTTTQATTTTTTTTGPTKPPIIYQFNTKDFESVPRQQFVQNVNYDVARQPQQPFIQQQNQVQLNKHIKTPTFEFISVPPVSYSTSLANNNNNNSPKNNGFSNQNYFQSSSGGNKFRQDPLPSNQILFPSSNNVVNRFHRNIGLNTFYEGDGLNYLPRGKSNAFLSGI